MPTRDLSFIGLCLLATGALGASLFGRGGIEVEATSRPEPPAHADVVKQVDEEFRRTWTDLSLTPAPRASSLTVARRLSLGLTGTVPSLEEIRALESLEERERVSWWTSRLLEDRRYSDYVAERLARAYVGTENGPFLLYRRRRFVTWLSDQLHRNVGYDELARRMLGDTGLWTDKPSVNFVTVTVDQNEDSGPDPMRLAARTSRAFLGVRIDCLQCHDDRLGNVVLGDEDDPRDGLQSDFHQLAAFFAETDHRSLTGIHDDVGRKYEYRYLNADDEQVVEPRVPFPPAFDSSGDDALRRQLAAWVTHPENKPFARAIVNRVWALMFGRGLVEPIDDIPLHDELPPGLDTLADDFVAHDFDLRRLIRIISETEVFQADSRAEHELTAEHERHWAVFPVTRLRPEQVAGGAIQAASLRTIDAYSHILAQLARFAQQNDFVKRYGDTGEDEFAPRGGTVTQRLIMMNGKMIHERTESSPFNAAARVALLAPTDRQAIETAYLTVLTRRPTARELDHFADRLAGADTERRRREVLEDIYWVLLNGSEFCWNH